MDGICGPISPSAVLPINAGLICRLNPAHAAHSPHTLKSCLLEHRDERRTGHPRWRLHWTAILSEQIRADLAITGGVHTGENVLKSMMASARVAMMTSALLKHGVEHARTVIEQVKRWMEEHEYESIRKMRGSMSRRSAPRATAFERVNYMRVLSSYVAR